MTDKITQEVKEIVDSIFKQKEEANMRKETEDALNKSADKISELTTSLEAKDEELAGLSDKLTEFESTIAELSDAKKELEENLEKTQSDLESEKDELVKRAEAAEEDLDNLKKDQFAQKRFEELKESGVAAVEEKAINDQIAKIREMEDKEFTAYKSERVELRESIVSELEASNTEELNENGDGTNANGVDEKEAANSQESIDPMRAVAAMLNMEIKPNDDVLGKYRELGEAMADKYVKKGEGK